MNRSLLHRRAAWLWMAIAVAILAATLGAAPLGDPDEFMHAALGRWMVQHGHLTPTPDPLVWSDRGGDAPHEWLAQLAMGVLVSDGDLAPLRWLKAALVVAAASLVWSPLYRRRQGSAAPAAWPLAAVSTWLLLVAPHVAMRPHLLAWLPALWWTLWALPHDQPWTRRHWLAAAVVLVVWANLHSSVLIAPLYAGAWWLGSAWMQRRPLRCERQRGLQTAMATVLALCQPMGAGIIGYVWRSQQINARWSDEWQPLLAADVRDAMPLLWLAWWAIALAVAVLTVHLVLRRLRGDALESWTGGWLAAVMAVVHAAATRRMTLFLAVPIAWLAVAAVRRMSRAVWGWLIATVACSGLAPWLGAALQPSTLQTSAFPLHATAFLEVTRPQGRLANPDPWGGWLAWHLHPPQQVMADGRWLLGGSDVIASLLALQARAPSAEAVAARYGIEVFIERARDAAHTPALDPAQWLLAWRDKTAVVWLRRGPHLTDNIARICGFYASRPALQHRARWPAPSRPPHPAVAGRLSAADVPSVLSRCPAPAAEGAPPP
jgi:hypothetical protein